jgi:hypothetical protein
MDVLDIYQINDNRKNEDFRKKTFSGYSKKDVFDILFKKIDEGSIEEVCQWSCEIVISGYYNELWERVINYMGQYIGIKNPLLPYFLFQRLIKFVKVKNLDFFKKNELELKNSQEVRNLVAEILCILAQSTKSRKSLSLVKIYNNEFSPEGLQSKLLAKDLVKADKFIQHGDPQELNIIINELAHNISEFKFNLDYAIYWLSWIFEWEKILLKKKKNLECGNREINGIDKKFRKDFIWIIWEVLLDETDNRNNEILLRQIRSLYEFYKLNFTTSKKRKRVNLIIHAIQLLSNTINLNEDYIKRHPVIEKYHIVVQACGNINLLYKKKKISENMESDEVNSRIKQEATYVVTKYENISLINDKGVNKYKIPKYLKDREEAKKKADNNKNKKEKSSQEKRMEAKKLQLSAIDDLILSNSNNRDYPFYKNNRVYNEGIKSTYNNDDSKKTINIIKNIDKNINKKKDKIDSNIKIIKK